MPRTGSTFQVLPAEAKRLEGLDPSLAIIDEIGVVDRRVYEVVALASGKPDQSLVLAIGTPSPDGPDSVMWGLREHALEAEDPSFRFAECSAGAGCDIDDEEAWKLANPALDDFLHRDAMRALLSPKTRDATFRRVRLGQWVDQLDEPWLPPGAWDACEGSLGVPDGAEVVLGFDGSFNGDCTALVAVSVADVPHVEVVALWESPGVEGWQAGPGDCLRPVPVGQDVPGARRRGPPGGRAPAVPGPDDPGDDPVLRGGREPHAHPRR